MVSSYFGPALVKVDDDDGDECNEYSTSLFILSFILLLKTR